MKCELFIDPLEPPWRTYDRPITDNTVGVDELISSYDGEGYELLLRFGRKGRSNRFYLVGIVRSSWDNADLEARARST